MKLRERIFREFLDVIILRELENDHALCGNEIRTLIHKRFRVLVSSGSIYSRMDYLERNGLIEGIVTSTKRAYRLTEKGRDALEKISESSDMIALFTKSILDRHARGEHI